MVLREWFLRHKDLETWALPTPRSRTQHRVKDQEEDNHHRYSLSNQGDARGTQGLLLYSNVEPRWAALCGQVLGHDSGPLLPSEKSPQLLALPSRASPSPPSILLIFP